MSDRSKQCRKSYPCNLLRRIHTDNCAYFLNIFRLNILYTYCICFFLLFLQNLLLSCSLPRKMRMRLINRCDDILVSRLKFPVFKLYMYEVNVERAWCCLCQERKLAGSAAHPNPGAEFGARIGHVLLQVPKVYRKTRRSECSACWLFWTHYLGRIAHRIDVDSIRYFYLGICTHVHACGTLIARFLSILSIQLPAIPILRTLWRALWAFEKKKEKRKTIAPDTTRIMRRP